jgi:hypothetical protein
LYEGAEVHKSLLVADKDTALARIEELEGELAVAFGDGSTAKERKWFSALDRANTRIEELEKVLALIAGTVFTSASAYEIADEVRRVARQALQTTGEDE